MCGTPTTAGPVFWRRTWSVSRLPSHTSLCLGYQQCQQSDQIWSPQYTQSTGREIWSLDCPGFSMSAAVPLEAKRSTAFSWECKASQDWYEMWWFIEIIMVYLLLITYSLSRTQQLPFCLTIFRSFMDILQRQELVVSKGYPLAKLERVLNYSRKGSHLTLLKQRASQNWRLHWKMLSNIWLLLVIPSRFSSVPPPTLCPLTLLPASSGGRWHRNKPSSSPATSKVERLTPSPQNYSRRYRWTDCI